ncbi:MAG: sigma-54-dependent Fis family transcriptional regulator [Myxococcales bacterium]|nr:sigma-54-dependent Fis family transcriptional regulator [Myxococcales bacterium]
MSEPESTSEDRASHAAIARVGVVDDEPAMRRALRARLEKEGYLVTEFESGAAIVRQGGAGLDALCLDLGLAEDDLSGMEVIPHLRTSAPDLPIIVVTGQSDLESVIDAMRAGAWDFVTKPVDSDRLKLAVRRAIERTALTKRVADLTRELGEARLTRQLVGQSAPMKSLFDGIRRVFDSDVAVCILGESGTGKELVARAIHEGGRRRKGPFVPINCAAIPEHLQESELFGHEKGAFTGATATYRGRFEQAEGGTLFLDELGDMSPATQVKLLRALQEKTIRRVGGTVDIPTNVRIVAATHRDLEDLVRKNAFREDLYFRLMVYPIEVPPLRERPDDIPLLAAHFLRTFRDDVGRDLTRISSEALEALVAHSWPGNVRELQNIVHRAMLTCDGDRIELKDLPAPLRKPVLPPVREPRLTEAPVSSAAPHATGLPTLLLRDLERLAFQEALAKTKGHIASAAKMLGIGRATLYRRVVEVGMNVEPPEGPLSERNSNGDG